MGIWILGRLITKKYEFWMCGIWIWLPRGWQHCNSGARADSFFKLVAKYMFWGMSYPTVYIKMASGHPKCSNPRWLPKWPPNTINVHNSGPRADSLFKLVAKCMFLGMSYPTVYIKMASGHPNISNPWWLPKWPLNTINAHNSGSRADSFLISVSKCKCLGITFLNVYIKMTPGPP